MDKFKEMYGEKKQIKDLFDVTKKSLGKCAAIDNYGIKDFKERIPKKVYECAIAEANWDLTNISEEKEFTESMKSLKAYVKKIGGSFMVYTHKDP